MGGVESSFGSWYEGFFGGFFLGGDTRVIPPPRTRADVPFRDRVPGVDLGRERRGGLVPDVALDLLEQLGPDHLA